MTSNAPPGVPPCSKGRTQLPCASPAATVRRAEENSSAKVLIGDQALGVTQVLNPHTLQPGDGARHFIKPAFRPLDYGYTFGSGQPLFEARANDLAARFQSVQIKVE